MLLSTDIYILNTFKSYCEAITELHTRHAHREKHKCVLFVAHCFRQAHLCFKDPREYDRVWAAWPEPPPYYDSFSSESSMGASNLLESDSELVQVESSEGEQAVAGPVGV